MYIRIKQVFLIILIISFGSAFADSATQTDWSGGDGVLGPVLDWGNEFFQSSCINWSDNPGSLLLSYDILKHTVDADFYGATFVYSEDIDGDGDMDVLGASYFANDITWWENSDTNPGIYWVRHTIDGDFNGAYSVYSEDIDGDGDMDVLGAAHYDDDITWWENINGLGTSWVEHTVDGNFNSAHSVYSEDINGDGDMDVLGAAAFPGNNITWWENNDGLGTLWVEHIVDGDYHDAHSVHSEDMDGDGDMDVLGASWYDNDITWWENIEGSGTSWTEHTVDGDFNGARSVYSEDIDGDGDMDVLGAASQDNDITWWDLNGYSPNGSLESSILDTQCSPQWASIDWNSSEPAETDLYFQYKTSDDPGNMGAWSEPIYEPCFLSGLLDRYFQYKVLMETDDPDFTPVLHDLTLNWDPLGVGDDPQVTEYLLFGAEPNPASGSVSISFAVPELSPVELYIFDLSGRLVSEIHGDEYSPGYHDVLLDDFSPGIYFCRMISGDFTAKQSFVVIE